MCIKELTHLNYLNAYRTSNNMDVRYLKLLLDRNPLFVSLEVLQINMMFRAHCAR